jgi:aminoglycoside 3-N-acetyltransferase
VIDPFDKNSLFQSLIDSNALIVYYGVLGIHSSTIVHYCERLSGKLCYRYDKLFCGEVTDNGQSHEVRFNFHVRPKDRYLDYDWSRLEKYFVNEGVLQVARERRFEFRCAKAKTLADYWIQKLQADPLYLLDGDSRTWVEPELQRLGRSFLLSDFE